MGPGEQAPRPLTETSSVGRHRIRGAARVPHAAPVRQYLRGPGCIPQSRTPIRQDEGQRISKTINIIDIKEAIK